MASSKAYPFFMFFLYCFTYRFLALSKAGHNLLLPSTCKKSLGLRTGGFLFYFKSRNKNGISKRRSKADLTHGTEQISCLPLLHNFAVFHFPLKNTGHG